MCRLYGFRGSAPSKLECSLVRAQNALMAQSQLDSRGLSNGDGWGIGFYRDREPAVEKRDTAAYQDLRFRDAASRIVSPTVLAHVRKATVGGVGAVNTHPFATGVWSFAHNGTLTGFDRLAPNLEREIDPDLSKHRHGVTDSELIFLWMLSRLRKARIRTDKTCPDPRTLLTVFTESVRSLAARNDAVTDKPAQLNMLLTDGSTLLASRWGTGLYRLEREGVQDCQICGLPHVEDRWAGDFRAALIASEAITSEPWEEIPEANALAIAADIGVTTEQI